MSRQFSPEVIAAQPRYKRGRFLLHQAQDAYDKRNSPAGRNGRKGGLITARRHPHKARDPRGRFQGASTT